jgi:TolB protein
MRPRATVILGTVAFVTTTLLAPSAAWATFPGSNGKIAFQRGGNIWGMNPDGTGQVRLTSSGTAANPQWSASGRRIAFDQGSASSGRDIWVMNANGGNKYRVTTHAMNEYDPAWSPSGTWLAFATDRNGRGEIFKIRSTSPFGRAVRLTRTAGTGEPVPTDDDPYLSDSQPNWSPSGTRIAFSRFERTDDASSGGFIIELTTMNPDGSGVRQKHDQNGLAETCPSWGPGGGRISWVDDEYEFEFGSASNNVWHSNLDGPDQRNVTHFARFAPPFWDLGCASWSPSRGAWIVFSGAKDADGDGNVDGGRALYKVASNGLSEPTLLIARGNDPDWGPATA